MAWALLFLFGVFCVGGFAVGAIFALFLIRPAHSLEMRANEAFVAISADVEELGHAVEVLEQRANGAIKIVQGHGNA